MRKDSISEQQFHSKDGKGRRRVIHTTRKTLREIEDRRENDRDGEARTEEYLLILGYSRNKIYLIETGPVFSQPCFKAVKLIMGRISRWLATLRSSQSVSHSRGVHGSTREDVRDSSSKMNDSQVTRAPRHDRKTGKRKAKESTTTQGVE
jgi:hypothetical protein